MSFNRENYVKVKTLFAEKKRLAQQRASQQREALRRQSPELDEVEKKLGSIAPRLFAEAMKGSENIDERINRLKCENLELLAKRERILVSMGYPKDALEVKYSCPLCNDEGSVNGKMCTCMRRELVTMGIESSGLGRLVRRQSFETFDLSYCKDSPEIYEDMKEIFELCRKYAETFRAGADSLLFVGGTGLGKTHLCTSIGKRIVERGYDVVYETAPNIFADFEAEKFGKDQDKNRSTRRYFEAELLLIDDLGAEMTTQYTVSVLYNLLNTRLNKELPMVINTNLDFKDLMNRYDQRIYSRLMGEFVYRVFKGTDVRMKKLR